MDHRVAPRSGFDLSGPTHRRRHPDPAFEVLPLSAAVGPVRAFRFPEAAVVIGEENEGVLVDSMIAQGIQNPAGAGIDLSDQGLHDVVFGLGQPRSGDHVGGVDGGVRNVTKKRLVLVLVDEVDGQFVLSFPSDEYSSLFFRLSLTTP